MMYKTFATAENNYNTESSLADWLGTSCKARTERKKAAKEAELHNLVDEASARATVARANGRKKSAAAYENMAAQADKDATRLMRDRVTAAISASEVATENDKEAKFIKGLVIAGGAAFTGYMAYQMIKDNMQQFKELANALVK